MFSAQARRKHARHIVRAPVMQPAWRTMAASLCSGPSRISLSCQPTSLNRVINCRVCHAHTWPRMNKLLLIAPVSLTESRAPVLPVLLSRSEPARSTSTSFPCLQTAWGGAGLNTCQTFALRPETLKAKCHHVSATQHTRPHKWPVHDVFKSRRLCSAAPPFLATGPHSDLSLTLPCGPAA
jgi:hypothetical protein